MATKFRWVVWLKEAFVGMKHEALGSHDLQVASTVDATFFLCFYRTYSAYIVPMTDELFFEALLFVSILPDLRVFLHHCFDKYPPEGFASSFA